MLKNNQLSRRHFLKLSLMSGGALALAACRGGSGAEDEGSVPVASAKDQEGGSILVGDVVDYTLSSDEWAGAFGSVTFKAQRGYFDGEDIYFIRTDSSDESFATRNKLVHVPLLAAAAGRDIAATYYDLGDNNRPVLSSAPSDEDFISLFQIKRVTGGGDLKSAAEIEEAASAGSITIEETTIFVNYPVVKWPGGELPVDTEQDSYLGTGQLLAPVDTAQRRVTFKLHECFPGSRYIVTDTSAAPMAPMMSIAASPPSQGMVDAGGTDEIWVFANGIAGSGVMGFQPAIFDNQAGQPAWSPFWNHFTLKWEDESQSRVLESSVDVREALAAGEVELFNGTPDSHPNGFVVNCPVPILADNRFTA